MKIEERLKLNSGGTIPQLGFGVWKAKRNDCYKAVLVALEAGYRHIDTAAIYGNEGHVGRAIAESGIERKELFVTTKLWNSAQGYEKSQAAIKKSLDNLQLDYVDLYLIHFPVADKRLDSWRGLIEIQQKGLSKHIGVSNFTQPHLEELIAKSDIKPAINQVEFHPWLNQQDLKSFCEGNGILLQAYSPLSHGEKLSDPALASVAAACNRTPAQILLRWGLQMGNAILPKSVTPERIRQNAALFDFELSEETMKEIATWNENLRTCWDPTEVP